MLLDAGISTCSEFPQFFLLDAPLKIPVLAKANGTIISTLVPGGLSRPLGRAAEFVRSFYGLSQQSHEFAFFRR